MTRSKATRLRIFAAVATVLLVAACSSSKSSGGSGGSSGGATKSTWTIGSIITQTGSSSAIFGAAKNVMQAWVSYTNSHGGINGHPIKLVVMDDQNTPSVGLADAHTLVNRDHILALVGSEDNSAPGWKDYLISQGVPIVGTAGAVGLAFKPSDKLFYPTGTDLAIQKKLGLVLAKQQNATKIGAVYCSESVACLQGANATQAAVQAAGYTFTKAIKVATTAPSYVAPCIALRDAGTTTIQLSVVTTTVQAIADACAQQGYYPLYLATAAAITNNWTTDPAFRNAGGAIDSFPWWHTTVPAIALFNSVMAQYYPDSQAHITTAAQVWSSAMAFEEGAKAGNLGDNPTNKQLADGMDTISNDTLGGLVPALTFTNGNRSVKCGYVFLIKNNQFTLANNNQQACAS